MQRGVRGLLELQKLVLVGLTTERRLYHRPQRLLRSLAVTWLVAACSNSGSTKDSAALGGSTSSGSRSGGASSSTDSGGTNLGGNSSTTGGNTANSSDSRGGASLGGMPSLGGSAGSSSATTLANSGGGSSSSGGGSQMGGTAATSSVGGGSTAGGTSSSASSSGAGGSTVTSGGGGIGGASSGGTSSTSTATGGVATAGATGTPTFGNADEEILYRAVRFYGAERCGDGHNWTLVGNPNGTKCHLRDGEPEGLDLSGGWHDAGDHVKVTLTIAYAAYALLKAYEIYPTAFKDFDDPNYGGRPNGIPDVLDEARFGLDWLVKAHPDANRLVAMVANSDYDHSTFMTSPKASTNSVDKGGDPRPIQMGAKADFAGLAAAALALASKVYATVDATLAANYLAKAKTAYAFAKARPGLSTSMLYAWTGSNYTDDLMCGAAELWRATSDEGYLTDALNQNKSIGPTKYLLNYSQISDLCRHSLVKSGKQEALAPWTTDVDRYTTLLSTNANIKGLIYLEKWGTCRHAMSAAFSAALLYDVTKTAKYRDFAKSQYAWIKGENPQGRSYVIGWGNNPPTRPHHRNAYGYEDDAGWDADTPQLSDTRAFRHLLVGGLVGGPNLEGYQDSVNDYIHNEVAIDYNAGLVGAAAFAVVNP